MLTSRQAAWIGGATALAFLAGRWRANSRGGRKGDPASEHPPITGAIESFDEALEGVTPGMTRGGRGQESPHLEIPQNFASSPES